MTSQQMIVIGVASIGILIMLIFFISRDDAMSVENATDMLARVPQECRQEAGEAMVRKLTEDEDTTMDDLREAVAPILKNCAIIGALSAQAKK